MHQYLYNFYIKYKYKISAKIREKIQLDLFCLKIIKHHLIFLLQNAFNINQIIFFWSDDFSHWLFKFFLLRITLVHSLYGS